MNAKPDTDKPSFPSTCGRNHFVRDKLRRLHFIKRIRNQNTVKRRKSSQMGQWCSRQRVVPAELSDDSPDHGADGPGGKHRDEVVSQLRFDHDEVAGEVAT